MEELMDQMSKLSSLINNHFSRNMKTQDQNEKWVLLKEFHVKYLNKIEISTSLLSEYNNITSILLEALKPTLFQNKWQENIFDSIFLQGVHHEAFMVLVRKLDISCQSYQRSKILSLLEKFLQKRSFHLLILQQCLSRGTSDPEYLMLSCIWNDLITLIVSLPERVANKTKGIMLKIFHVDYYVPLLLSSVLKTMFSLHQTISESQNCTIEFIGKLIGKLCILGYSDKVTERLSMVLVKQCEKDFIWRQLCQNLITKMPFPALEPYTKQLLLSLPWYGYIEWILGDQGIKNTKLNYILTTKLILIRHFKKPLIIQNIIGYYAGNNTHQDQFYNILNSLLQTWSDESALKHQSVEQQTYLASALVICAGWINKLKDKDFRGDAYISNALHGTNIRIGNSEVIIRNLGMVVGSHLLNALQPDAPKIQFKDSIDKNILLEFEELLTIPSDPGKNFLYSENLNCFNEKNSEKEMKICTTDKNVSEEIEPNMKMKSEDDLEAYDMSNDVCLEAQKRPFFLNDCLQGLIEQEDADWIEQCLRYAESLIESNSDIIDEVALEMAKVVIHLEDKYKIQEFHNLKHRILVSLTVHSPVLVSEYLACQFYEKEYDISQRLFMLDVLTQASRILSEPSKEALPLQNTSSKSKFTESVEKTWKSIVDQRVASKTKFIKKTPSQTLQQTPNRFSAIAGYFFYPLLSKYDKSNSMLNLFGDDSYVLGRLIYTLGVVMLSASNTVCCKDMGKALLQFSASVRNHTDVFVRQASIFAITSVYSSVPGYLLFTDGILEDVDNSKEWLLSTINEDPDTNCQLKASHAVSYLMSILKEEAPQLQSILNKLK